MNMRKMPLPITVFCVLLLAPYCFALTTRKEPKPSAPAINSDCGLAAPQTTADIQKAVDAGGIVKFAPGIYELTQTIVLRKSNTIIQGSGPGTVFVFKPTRPQVHCVNDRAFTTPCDVVNTARRQIKQPIAIGDHSFSSVDDVSDLVAGDWLIIEENDRQAGPVIIDWAQVASVSGDVVQLRTSFRTAFPKTHSWDPNGVSSGLGFQRIPHLVEGVQFRDFTVLVPDSGEGVPGISVFAAKGTLIDGVIAQAENGQPLYSYLAKELTVCNSYADGTKSQSASEFASTVDLVIKNNTFSSESAALALDLGTAFFDVSRNYIPASTSIGLYLLYGIHDGIVDNNVISFVRSPAGATGANSIGIAARGCQRVTITRNYLAGGFGSSSMGLTIGAAYSTEVSIPSSQNVITPNSFGSLWGVNYDPSNVP